jgi:hypothetical protein
MYYVGNLVYIFLGLGLAGGLAGLLLITIYTKNSLIKKWLYFLTMFNILLGTILYVNIISPLVIFGRAFHILAFIVLLIAFSSLFIIFHEIKEKEWFCISRKLTFSIITVWSLLGVFLFLFEVFFRIFPIYDTSAINPGVKFFWPDYVNYPLNNMGFRDRPFALKKNPHTYRIMVVGDSYAEGAGCRREETFSRVLERELNRRLKAAGCPNQVEVYNLSRCGANTVGEVQVIMRKAPVLQPNLIILAYVLNDPEVHPPDLKTFDPPAWVTAIHRIFLEEIHSYAYYWFFTKYTLFPGSVPQEGTIIC